MYRVPGSGRTLRLIRKLRNKSVSNFNPIFITGIAGSGNTLLASLIDERLQVDGFADESALYASGRSFIKIPHVKLFRSPLQYREAMKISEGLDKKDLIREYEREYRKYLVSRGNRNVIVDKAPNAHMVRCASLLDAYPDSLFILVYRNPVSQVEGLIRKWELFKNSV